MAEYLLPKPPRRGYEFFPGWGIPEVGWAALGLAAGAGVWGLTTLLDLPVPARALGAVLCLVVGGALGLPQPGGQPPLWRTVAAWRAWATRPHRREYAWHADD